MIAVRIFLAGIFEVGAFLPEWMRLKKASLQRDEEQVVSGGAS
jgi:hypothetical protein